MKISSVSLVAPCLNEAPVLNAFYRRIDALANKHREKRFDFIFVNDGSTDETTEILDSLAETDTRVKVLHFAKNFGHQAAITAGIDFSEADLTVTIDADLQDPPEVISAMIAKAEEGFDVIHGQRSARAGEPRLRLLAIWLFYKIIRLLSTHHLIENVGDFRAFNDTVREAFRTYRERHRYLRGIFADIGFKQCVVVYDRDPRHAGKTKYTFIRLLRLALNGIVSFSSSPLRLITWLSLILWATSLIYLFMALWAKFVEHESIPGWTSIIILLVFFSGLQLFCIGILGSYIGRIFEQGQQRPIYWVMETRNLGVPKEPKG